MDYERNAPSDVSYHHALSSETLISSAALNVSRQRSPSSPPTSSHSGSVQVIANLIDSLSAIAASPREHQKEDPIVYRAAESTIEFPHRPGSPTPPEADELDRDLNDPPFANDSSDEEAAAPPVAGYARRFPVLPKKKPSKSRLYSLNMSQSGLGKRASQISLQSRAESESVGIPSIERRHGSSVSSTFSIISGRSVLHRISTTESLHEKTAGRPVLPKRMSSDRRRKAESLYSVDQEKENRYPTRTSSLDGYANGVQTENGSGDSPTVAALSRLSKGDLGNHLIPSRRSSLRRSSPGLSDSADSQRYSTPTRTMQQLNIDADLMEGDNSTVRRIRELQEAREQRQKEWRNEARKSEKTAKRHTIATPKILQRGHSYPNSRLSVTEVVVETPEPSSPVEMTACVTAADLATMPSFVPVTAGGDQLPLKRLASDSHSATPSSGNSVYMPSKKTQTQSKRNSGVLPAKQETPISDLKSISDEVDAFLSAPRFTQKIRHPRTGRTIAFSEVGDPNGFVVMCCVGMGLTRYLTAFYDDLAKTQRLRLITPDRPGVGESTAVPEQSCTPLNWVDDVAVICSSLEITRFSLLAHSAGAIYALATALKMPQYVRGRIHLLAPWIPPSQMPKGAAIGPDSQPIANLPFSHKILSVLPAQFLKVANSRFLTATSASVDAKPIRTGKKNKNIGDLDTVTGNPFYDMNEDAFLNSAIADMETEQARTSPPIAQNKDVTCYQANNDALASHSLGQETPDSRRPTREYASRPSGGASRPMSPRLTAEARQALYNQSLTHRIWSLATANSNPAIDLVICLERRKTIGFRYPEVTRSVVIHHGAKDSRVPLDNVRWLQSVMKRCELRVLPDEGHGLMASATAMMTVLSEIAKEWEEWERIAKGKEKRKKDDSSSERTFSIRHRV